ncbi:MAG TPA: amino acid adenylation domain-containing protein [Pyrinomonadaceae bacterium]|nr:amino acid adenylation domain-containing protein [Pyrinomonadaceae bacterium]
MKNQVIEGFQLSPQQKHLWSLCGRDGATIYRSQCVVRIEGPLNKRILRQAIDDVVRRHEILRTSFRSLPGMDVPLQVINPTPAVTIIELDLQEIDASRQSAELDALLEKATSRIADCEQKKLFHVDLICLSPERHVLQITLPALCADAVGLDRLVGSIAQAYAALMNEDEQTEEPVQYADLSEWQNELLESEDTRAGREFWRRQDFSALRDLALPTEKQPAPDRVFDPQCFSVVVDSEKVAALAKRQEVAMSLVLLTCWQVLLWRLAGESDTMICAAFDGRKFSELDQALGLFAKYLPITSRLERHFTFSEALEQIAACVRDVSQWQECFTWGELEKTSTFSFDFSVLPAAFTCADLSFVIETRCSYIDSFQVRLSCIQDDRSLSLQFHYDASLYDENDVRRLAGQYLRLLESTIATPESKITELEILNDVERRQLLLDFNDTKEFYPLDKCLHQLFEEQAALTPDNVAVIFDGERLSYAELNKHANQLAHHLQRLGIGPDDLVGIYVERSLEMIVGMLGILKAGAAYVPLDPTYPRARLEQMLHDAGVSMLLTQLPLLETLPQHQAHVICLDVASEALATESDDDLQTSVSPANLAYVIYTSGSTGRPKGVMIPHHAIVNRLLWMQKAFPLTSEDLVLQKTPFSFDASVWEFFAPLLAGARLLIARPGGHKDNSYLVDVVTKEGVTTLQLVPSMYRVLLESDGIESCNGGLRRVFCGGEALPVALQQQSFAVLDADLHNLYGPTETAIDAAFWKCRPGTRGVTVPIGRPIGNMQIYLLDRDMRLVPTGVAGELYIGGVGVARGYLNRPDLTAERFVPNPFSREHGARLYRTGDLARYQAPGVIEFLGRLDEQVKLRGFRIELGEIEAALREHPALLDAVVVPREQAPDDRRLVGYVVMKSGSAVTPNELREFLRERLPEYMVPTSFVAVAALLLMPNGKVDRASLASSVETESRENRVVALPRDNLENQLVRIWKQVLGTTEQIGVTDNFFDLGGHSLLAVGLMAQIQKWFGQDLPLSILFEGATIAHLAEVLRGRATERTPSPLVPIQPKGSRPPFFCVHTGSGEVLCYEPWARYLDPDQPFYGVQDHFAYKDGDPEIPIEEMASIYVEAIRAMQPVGPYLLGGWSFGGLVAFEMARQLVELGHEVPLLVIVDAGAPAFMRKIIEADDAVLLTILANQLTRYSMKDEELRPLTQALQKLDANDQLQYVIDYFVERDLAGANVDMDYAFAFLKRHLRVFRTRIRVTHRYDPAVYPGHITVFRGSEEPPEVRGLDPTKGWGELSTQPVDVHIVPGNHETMGLEPNVKMLSAQLQSCLDAIRTESVV